jgi:hypothetical protein
MLNSLCSLTNNSILICDNISDIDFDALINKTILIFASSQIISSITKNLKPLTKIFILEEDKTKTNERGRFTNSEDLIFQLSDELCDYYKWEATDDSRSGDSSLAKKKEEIANRIHPELKKVQGRFSENEDDDKLTTCATALVWLTTMYDNDESITKIQNLFGNIVSSFSIFQDEQECYNYMCTIECDHFAFLIIDDDYQDVSGFQQFHNIKEIYRYVQSWANREKIAFRLELIHDLISHYNKLAIECNERRYSKNAKDMFLKASYLSKALIEF